MARLLLALVTDFLLPQPGERLRQDGAAVLAAVALLTHDEPVLVALVLQRRLHLEVGQRPAAVLVVEVALAGLEEGADRLPGGLADLARVDVAAADVREAADVAEHLAEQVRPLP